MPRKPTITIRLPLSNEELQFVLEHTTTEERCKALLTLAATNAGGTMQELATQRLMQEKFYKRYDELTTGLSKENQQLFTLGLPMTCNADSVDVENYIVNEYKQPVDDNNFIEVGYMFKAWYKEKYPTEYAALRQPIFMANLSPWR